MFVSCLQSTKHFTCLPLVGQLGPSGNFLCDQSLGILKALKKNTGMFFKL